MTANRNLSNSTLLLEAKIIGPILPSRITCFSNKALSRHCTQPRPLMPFKTKNPWPEHWCHNKDSIKCLVCGFTTQPNGLKEQFADLKNHCATTSGFEHAILSNMLMQRRCAMCSFQVGSGQTSKMLRDLFKHEMTVHGSDFMSQICGYIVLARKGRIWKLGPDSQKIAFDRMVEKLQGYEQPITNLLCQKKGVPHSISNLQEILSTDYLRPDGDAPLWKPVPAERFLWLLRPDENDPADHQWSRVWTRLRQMYSNGHL